MSSFPTVIITKGHNLLFIHSICLNNENVLSHLLNPRIPEIENTADLMSTFEIHLHLP